MLSTSTNNFQLPWRTQLYLKYQMFNTIVCKYSPSGLVDQYHCHFQICMLSLPSLWPPMNRSRLIGDVERYISETYYTFIYIYLHRETAPSVIDISNCALENILITKEMQWLSLPMISELNPLYVSVFYLSYLERILQKYVPKHVHEYHYKVKYCYFQVDGCVINGLILFR